MLKKIDYKEKSKSVYICDMCSKKIGINTKTNIFVKRGTDKSLHKKWDLCDDCYRMLVRSISKYNKKRTEKIKTEISV